MNNIIKSAALEHTEVFQSTFDDAFCNQIYEVGTLCANALRSGGRIFFMGNGGSAADSQHLAAEFVSKLSKDRQPLAAVSLTVDTSALTAIPNDYGFKFLFSRQIQALVQPKDIVIGITTSGRSENVLEGFRVAKEIGALTVALLGEKPLPNSTVDVSLCVRSSITARVQECHIFIGHMLCAVAEADYV